MRDSRYKIIPNGLFTVESVVLFDDNDPEAKVERDYLLKYLNAGTETNPSEWYRWHREHEGPVTIRNRETEDEPLSHSLIHAQRGGEAIIDRVAPLQQEYNIVMDSYLRDEAGQYPESTSVTVEVSREIVAEMTQEELINYLDQISREDV